MGRQFATYKNSTTYFSHVDWLGTVRLRSTVGGAEAERYTSVAFGDALSTLGVDPVHFTGQERDSESGLDHFMFRQYSSTQGRWMTPDPAGLAAVDPTNPQTWNRYAYVMNNPIAFVDPDGLVPNFDCGRGIITGMPCPDPWWLSFSIGIFMGDIARPLGGGGRGSPGGGGGGTGGSTPTRGPIWDGGLPMGGETLGIPNGFRMGGLSLCQLTGLCPIGPGCEFGACTPIGNGFTVAAAAPICLIAPEACILVGVASTIYVVAQFGPQILQFAQHGRGHVGDTGMEDEARRRFPNLDMCSALDIMMAEAKAVGDSAKIEKIKKTQKQYRCRRSR